MLIKVQNGGGGPGTGLHLMLVGSQIRDMEAASVRVYEVVPDTIWHQPGDMGEPYLELS